MIIYFPFPVAFYKSKYFINSKQRYFNLFLPSTAKSISLSHSSLRNSSNSGSTYRTPVASNSFFCVADTSRKLLLCQVLACYIYRLQLLLSFFLFPLDQVFGTLSRKFLQPPSASCSCYSISVEYPFYV